MVSHQVHVPVLVDAFLDHVNPTRQVWIDATFGNGGYSRALVDSGAEKVVALDCDPEAEARYQLLPESLRRKMEFVSCRFGDFDRHPKVRPFLPADGVVFDLGVSSPQLEQSERGFSFSRDGPLDMRMDNRVGMTAADIVNTYSEDALAKMLFVHGEERHAKRIVKSIVAQRKQASIQSTLELARLIRQAVPYDQKKGTHPATKTFMALRTVVNGEHDQLAMGLKAAKRSLKPGGIVAVVTFNSLEDRYVKDFFRSKAGSNRHRPELEMADSGFEVISKKPVLPQKGEVERNPRARSAKLRLVRKKGTICKVPSARHALSEPREIEC